MTLKKVELYRGFNIFAEEVRPAAWVFALVEIPSAEGAGPRRSPQQGQVPGEHPTKGAAVAATKAHIDRIQHNLRNRSRQETG